MVNSLSDRLPTHTSTRHRKKNRQKEENTRNRMTLKNVLKQSRDMWGMKQRRYHAFRAIVSSNVTNVQHRNKTKLYFVQKKTFIICIFPNPGKTKYVFVMTSPTIFSFGWSISSNGMQSGRIVMLAMHHDESNILVQRTVVYIAMKAPTIQSIARPLFQEPTVHRCLACTCIAWTHQLKHVHVVCIINNFTQCEDRVNASTPTLPVTFFVEEFGSPHCPKRGTCSCSPRTDAKKSKSIKLPKFWLQLPFIGLRIFLVAN